MHRLTASLCATALLLVSVDLGAQAAVPVKTIAKIPGSSVSHPTVSPDGKWMVFATWLTNSEARIMIQPFAGGTPRELQVGRGVHRDFKFTPQGDRIIFLSNLPRQDATENGRRYLVSAPFNTQTGTLSAPERPVILEPVRTEDRTLPAISPDGKSVAYVSCCNESDLRIVPIVGGNSRTLVTVKETEGPTIPGWIGWSSDGKFVTYHRRVGDQSTYLKVSASGGTPAVVSQWTGGAGFLMPGGRHFMAVPPRTPGESGTSLIIKSIDGRELGKVRVGMGSNFSFSADGKYLVGADQDLTSTMRVAAISGGASKQVGSRDGDEWPQGWAADARSLHFSAKENGKAVVITKDLDGRQLNRIEVAATVSRLIGIHGDWIVWREGNNYQASNARVMARNVKTGVQKQLAGDVLPCCSVTGPGGSYVGINGDEFFVIKASGEQMQVHGVKMTGESRLVAEVRRSPLGQMDFSVFKNRAVYHEIVADSQRLQMTTAPGKAPVTLATFPRAVRLSEVAWSYDGRQLSYSRNDQRQKLFVLRFDDAGAVQGPPREHRLPFEYFSEAFWLPDGSGMTMITQSGSGGRAEVALVRFADPSNPLFLSKADSGDKWGHSLSPDGKHVAYPVEIVKGSVVSVVEVAELLKRAGVSP